MVRLDRNHITQCHIITIFTVASYSNENFSFKWELPTCPHPLSIAPLFRWKESGIKGSSHLNENLSFEWDTTVVCSLLFSFNDLNTCMNPVIFCKVFLNPFALTDLQTAKINFVWVHKYTSIALLAERIIWFCHEMNSMLLF